MNDFQKKTLDTFKKGACKTWKFSMQNLLSKIISLIVIVLAILSIADGGYSQVFILIVGVALIIYIVGAFNKDIEKVIEDEIDDIISTDKKTKSDD
ncbi:hypothetical protein FLM55_00825 [Francisella sp. Scap27]|uniref:hypothetical protein n=1 Tax=Francisella sp. Scap27 TaxID=2589986 RepID=UPI0015B84FCF|nr:hypothetical protein [Francisella sp. Scap27]QLE78355.1 hypothetical protein FLM55_00825 [Francisella sp. Scap27]